MLESTKEILPKPHSRNIIPTIDMNLIHKSREIMMQRSLRSQSGNKLPNKMFTTQHSNSLKIKEEHASKIVNTRESF